MWKKHEKKFNCKYSFLFEFNNQRKKWEKINTLFTLRKDSKNLLEDNVSIYFEY